MIVIRKRSTVHVDQVSRVLKKKKKSVKEKLKVVLNEKLHFSQHITFVCDSVIKSSNSLKRNGDFRNAETRMCLHNTIISFQV